MLSSLAEGVSHISGFLEGEDSLNTLRAFCEAGLMTEVTVDGHKSYFDTRTDEHPHYYWEASGKLTDAPKSAVVFASQPEAPKGTTISRVDVVIRLREN